MEGQNGRIGGLLAIGCISGVAVFGSMTGFGAETAPIVATAPMVGSDVPVGLGSSVMLAWNPSPDASVSGYRIYQGTNSRNYSLVYDVGDGTNTLVAALQNGIVYYFAATAYDTNGLESDFSAELVYTNLITGGTPTITNFVKTADGNFSISGFGVAGLSCVLLGTTNLATPVQWTPIVTNIVDVLGYFSFVDLQATNYPRRFYSVLQPGTPVIILPLAGPR